MVAFNRLSYKPSSKKGRKRLNVVCESSPLSCSIRGCFLSSPNFENSKFKDLFFVRFDLFGSSMKEGSWSNPIVCRGSKLHGAARNDDSMQGEPHMVYSVCVCC